MSPSQLLAPPVPAASTGNATTFAPNMRLPVHRWFRYSAGFSAAWVEQAVQAWETEHGAPPHVLDPFAGSATTLLASQACGAPSLGIESHPFVARVAAAKLCWTACPDAFSERVQEILGTFRAVPWPDPPDLMAKAYPSTVLAELNGLRDAAAPSGDPALDALVWLALMAILRICSPVGTAQWQYVLPNRAKARVLAPTVAFELQARMMADDMRALARADDPLQPGLVEGDARSGTALPADWADLVITSPPYPNNFDYADATRLEMTFLREVERWGDLQAVVRSRLVHACSQQMARYDGEAALEDPLLAPIRDELHAVYRALDAIRAGKGGRKAYHLMVVAYFRDLAQVWRHLRNCCREESEMLVVIGDSAPYGIHVPAERWLGELALAAGFTRWSFTKLRDRNVKWKNRKHRVPLHEGILRITG